MRAWITKVPCDNCPFSEEGAGLQLRLSLGRGRWKEITAALLRGGHFLCHKTTKDAVEDDEGEEVAWPKGQICAGARAWQAERGIVSDAEQVISRLLAMRQGGEDAVPDQ